MEPSTPAVPETRRALFVLAGSWVTPFSKNRGQKAQQERAAEPAESLDIAEPEQTQISHPLRNSSTSQQQDPGTSWLVDGEKKEGYEHRKVPISTARCLAHRSSGKKTATQKWTLKQCQNIQ